MINLMIYKCQNYLKTYTNKWANNDYSDDISKINRYQIIKRERGLNQTEINDILSIKKNNIDLEIQCCTNILLENYIEAMDNLNNMEYSIRENFKEYPIYNLIKK